MHTRLERNRKQRKGKARIRMFILLTIVLVMTSIFQINRSYGELTGSTETSKLIAINKDEDSMGIILLGEQIEISKEYIDQGKEILQETQRKTVQWINRIIQKVSNY